MLIKISCQIRWYSPVHTKTWKMRLLLRKLPKLVLTQRLLALGLSWISNYGSNAHTRTRKSWVRVNEKTQWKWPKMQVVRRCRTDAFQRLSALAGRIFLPPPALFARSGWKKCWAVCRRLGATFRQIILYETAERKGHLFAKCARKNCE